MFHVKHLRNLRKDTEDDYAYRSLDIIQHNLLLLDNFFLEWECLFSWQRPQAGSIAFPRLRSKQSIEDFALDLVQQAGVMLLPGIVYDHPGNHFRIGFGRKNMPMALEKLERYLRQSSALR